jgi:hypothetical protein
MIPRSSNNVEVAVMVIVVVVTAAAMGVVIVSRLSSLLQSKRWRPPFRSLLFDIG